MFGAVELSDSLLNSRLITLCPTLRIEFSGVAGVGLWTVRGRSLDERNSVMYVIYSNIKKQIMQF